jgi:DNA-binding PadR family transcriptional regulator
MPEVSVPKPQANSSPTDFLPLAAADFQLLLVLSERDAHAYGLSKAVEASKTGVTLEIGSLYRRLTRMESDGLIEERDGAVPPDTPESRRRYYGITKLGRRVAQAEAGRLRAVLELAESKKLIASR